MRTYLCEVDVVDRLGSAVFPLELSLFTTPRIYEASGVPDPLPLVSFPVTCVRGLLTAAVGAVAVLVSSLASPLASDAFLKSYRQSTVLAINELFTQLEVHSEPKLLGRLLSLVLVWLEERPTEAMGIAGQVWRMVVRRIQTTPSPNEPLWNAVDDELANVLGHIKLDATGSGWPDIEAVVMYCASNDTMSTLRVGNLCGIKSVIDVYFVDGLVQVVDDTSWLSSSRNTSSLSKRSCGCGRFVSNSP